MRAGLACSVWQQLSNEGLPFAAHSAVTVVQASPTLPTCPRPLLFPPLQAQRQLQLSLEAHSRYITSLLEGSDLKNRLSSGAGGSVATSSAAAALEAAKSDPAEGGKAEQQQQQQQAAPGAQQQQEQQMGGGSPRQQQAKQQLGKQAPQAESGAAGAATGGTGSLTAFQLPGTTVGSVHAPSVQPLSPGSLIEGGAAEGAIAAAWDAVAAAGSVPTKLEAAAGGGSAVEVQVVAAPAADLQAAIEAEAAAKRQRTG